MGLDYWIQKTCNFIKLDIVEEFYPSISSELLEKSINFAWSIIEIEDKIINIIKHARKSLLFHDGNTWVNKRRKSFIFDVTIENYDGAEVCELVGFYLWSKVAPLVGTKHVGLFRDDGLAVIDQVDGPKMEKVRKKVMAPFESEGLCITMWDEG